MIFDASGNDEEQQLEFPDPVSVSSLSWLDPNQCVIQRAAFIGATCIGIKTDCRKKKRRDQRISRNFPVNIISPKPSVCLYGQCPTHQTNTQSRSVRQIYQKHLI